MMGCQGCHFVVTKSLGLDSKLLDIQSVPLGFAVFPRPTTL